MTYPQPGARQGASGGRLQTVLNVLSLVVVAFAAYESLGIGNLFGYQGLSNDDAQTNAVMDLAEALFDPIGFVIMLTLLIAAFVIHHISKKNYAFSNATTLGSLIATVVFFVIGFFKLSIIFPMLFSAAGSMGATAQNEPDERVPTAQEFTLDPAALIQYQRGEGVRIATAVSNAGTDHWQSATVTMVYSDTNGVACGQLDYVAEFVAPRERRPITTEFLPTYAYDDPSCVPVSVTADVGAIDIDSRAEIVASDYEQAQDPAALTPLTSLVISEEAGLGGIVDLSVTGSVDPVLVPGLVQADGEARLPLGFEVVDQEGLRLVWCFKPDEVAADGTFTTRKFHSPVQPGQYVSVAAVPKC